MKQPQGMSCNEVGFTQNKPPGLRDALLSPDLWQVPSSPNSLFSAVTQRSGINAHWSLTINHSVSCKRRQRYLESSERRLKSSPSRPRISRPAGAKDRQATAVSLQVTSKPLKKKKITDFSDQYTGNCWS